jgi:hypothetical protein
MQIVGWLPWWMSKDTGRTWWTKEASLWEGALSEESLFDLGVSYYKFISARQCNAIQCDVMDQKPTSFVIDANVYGYAIMMLFDTVIVVNTKKRQSSLYLLTTSTWHA